MNIILSVIAIIIFIILVFAVAYWNRNSNYYKREMKKVYASGFEEKQVTLDDGSVLNYAEGPNNGKALLLIHGQGSDWTSYSKNLPELSRHCHIYAIDCYGHGKSSHNSEKYSANMMGEDFKWFIKNVIKEKVVISGHSSGGLMTAWLASNSPEDVLGIVLEDPPFFSCEDNRKEKTFNYHDLSTICNNFINQSEEEDFPLYYFKNQRIWSYFPENAKNGLVNYATKYRSSHRDNPLIVAFLPPSMTTLFIAMNNYDPKFGESFFDGIFMKGFDHEETLSNIYCEAVLVHANWKYDDEGILEGAMTDDDANRAKSLMKDCVLEKVDSQHCVHYLQPEQFNKILIDFLSGR